ncbi:Protein CBG08107 [Caenorhabditis briggsae]|uniref:Protein CBG08107 n=1 Tax=Caenorhabditis briggsae TaxID=6238 RepID=A8X5U0_CAEBR|nr:Protein CBG08107 [Caenorhabditis briggsae]CAP28001.2 Protein CBG08107 [Caenorhabditis briggsae]
MFEKTKEVTLPRGTISPWPSNLAACWLDTRNITYVAVIQANNIGLVHPNARNFPIAIVGSTRHIHVYDVKKVSQKPLFSLTLASTLREYAPSIGKDVGPYSRGVSCNDNAILIGTHTGEIVVIMCNGDSNFTSRKNLKEHKSAVTDIATCRYDEITVSADSTGELIIWQKPVKGVNSRVLTKLEFQFSNKRDNYFIRQPINVINVLRKQVIVGTLRGLVQYYSVTTGDLMCEINAHSRPVNSVSVAPESAYVMTSSEDGTFIVSKLHTRKPHAYQVEYRFSDSDPYSIIMGAQFTNGRGSAIAVATFDSSEIIMYKIIKKSSAAAASS